MKSVAIYSEVSQSRSASFAPVANMLKNGVTRTLAAVKTFFLGKAFSAIVVFACMFVFEAHNCGDMVVSTPLRAVLCVVSFVAAMNVWWCIFVGKKGIRAALKELLSEDD